MEDEMPGLKTSQLRQEREEENRGVKGVRVSLTRVGS